MSFERDRAVVVMGRLPRAGRVKTRLTSAMSEANAARLYEAFLRDVLDLVEVARAELDFRVFFSVALFEGDRMDEAKSMLPSLAWSAVVQTGATLGARIEHARASAHADHVVIIGSDSPTMAPSRLIDALRALDEDSVSAVFGPTLDGGYDLIGLDGPAPSLLTNIPWSTPEVMTATRAAAAAASIGIRELPMGYDIDSPADLKRALEDASAPGSVARRTRRAIADVLALEPAED